jgi:hypothetical protein
MVQYYTLEQAAQILRTTPDELKEMAKRNEVRAFQDRGTWRFRSQEINELARLKGIGSDAELQLGEAAAGPKAPGPKSPAPKTGKQTAYAPGDAGTFDFSLDPAAESDEVPIGKEPAAGPGKSPGRPGSKPPSSKGSTKSPPPKAASDSDVRLVMDGSDLDFQIAVDSDVSVAKDPAAPKTPGKTPGKKSAVRPPEKPDSGVRIVPLDRPSDSDVRIDGGAEDVVGHERAKTPSDSDIRLEEMGPAAGPRDKGSDDALVTEEIDLDAESRKAAEAGRPKAGKRPRSKVTPPLPTSSPFELSEGDISVEAPKTPGKGPKSPGKAPKGPKTPDKKSRSPEDKEGETDSSSDFELTPIGESSSPLEPGSSGDIPLMHDDDDEVSLGELTGTSGGSGINLREPVDSGISLEQGGSDEIDFELSLDAGASRTPKPKPVAPQENVDSSSEFELSLDPDSSPVTGEDSDSEFELSLDADGSDLGLKAEGDSSSEFELTLDEEGGLAPVDESSSVEAEAEQDIFETDFEVPALDEESGSEAVALEEGDTDLESSDFDLSLNEEDASASASGEGGSESQVVALEDEEEEADSGAATVARPRRAVSAPAAGAAESEEELAGIEQDLEGEPEEEEEAAVAAAPAAEAKPAEWGVLPALVLFPCTIVLFVVGLMSFELVQGLWGYHRSTKVSRLLVDPIARMFDDTLPKD